MIEESRVVFSVSRLNRAAKLLLNEQFGMIWVEGEISNLARPSSGHWYFSLKDSEAQIRCVMFKPRNRLLAHEVRDGDHVLVAAQASLYEPRGDFQLIVDQLESAGDGALRRAFEALKRKLQAEGLFETARKRPIPLFPRQLGVVTSPSGAAIHDVLTVLRRRFPALPVVLFPTAVQGQTAKAEIVDAIAAANRLGTCDVLLLVRGGGSLEDLWSFNEESVARAIANSAIPIVTGIGHEVDFTIADFVADLRAATPSAAAETVSPDGALLTARVAKLSQQLGERMNSVQRHAADRQRWLAKRLEQAHPQRQLQRQAQRLDELDLRLRFAARNALRMRLDSRTKLASRLTRLSPDRRVGAASVRHANLRRTLSNAMQRRLEAWGQRRERLNATLRAFSPLATLERGYAIVFRDSDGRLIRRDAEVQAGELLRTRLAEGTLLTRVEGNALLTRR